jgi:hypothetical protein
VAEVELDIPQVAGRPTVMPGPPTDGLKDLWLGFWMRASSRGDGFLDRGSGRLGSRLSGVDKRGERKKS